MIAAYVFACAFTVGLAGLLADDTPLLIGGLASVAIAFACLIFRDWGINKNASPTLNRQGYMRVGVAMVPLRDTTPAGEAHDGEA